MDPEERYELTPEEELELDRQLDKVSQTRNFDVPEGWVHFSIAVPEDFYEIYRSTLAAYMKLRESEKVFPGFEAMILEARNSLQGLEDAQ